MLGAPRLLATTTTITSSASTCGCGSGGSSGSHSVLSCEEGRHRRCKMKVRGEDGSTAHTWDHTGRRSTARKPEGGC